MKTRCGLNLLRLASRGGVAASRKGLVFIICAAVMLISLPAIVTPTLAAAPQSGPVVAVTIRPVHSLVASIMQGVGVPQLIFDTEKSVHEAVLRPSQMGFLQDADLVVWIGRGIEHELIRPMQVIGGSGRVLTLGEVAAINWRPLVSANYDDAHEDEHLDHKDHDGHEDHEDHDDSARDWHIWLDAGNAITMARTITARLVAIDPAHADNYRLNSAKLIADITAIDAHIGAAIGGGHYVALHDAYGYFTHRYGWHSLGSLLVGHEIAPSIADVRHFAKQVQLNEVDCLINDLRGSQNALDLVRGDSDVPLIALDPLGVTIAPGPAHYAQLLAVLGAGLAGCHSDL